MKASTPIFKILSAVMLAAVVIYFTVQAYRYFSDPINTTLVYASTEETVLEVNGYLIRDEETFHSDAGTLAHTLSEGERVGKGQTLAMAYSDSGALTRVERLEALKLRQEQLAFSLVSYLDPDAALKLDSSINADILSLRQSIAEGEYSNAEEELSSLKGAILKRDYTSVTQDEIEESIGETEREISELERSLGGTAITAPEAGIYSAACDGYESLLTPEFLQSVTPSQLEELPSGQTGGTAADTFTVVTLSNGQTLTGGIGCEVMLRVGTAVCVSPSSPGLIDESSAATLNNSGALVTNHLYMMTIEGRGVKATAATVKLLVRGSYTIA